MSEIDFLWVYLKESQQLLEALTGADPRIRKELNDTIFDLVLQVL